MEKVKYTHTKVFRINSKLVVAYDIEEAILIYKSYYIKSGGFETSLDTAIKSVELVYGDSIRTDCDALIKEK